MNGVVLSLVALFAFCLGLLLTPVAGRLAVRLGFVARPNPDVRTHVRVVPLLGGIGIVGGTIPGLALAIVEDSRWSALAAGLLVVALLGAFKDRIERPVSPVLQLAVQTVAVGCLLAGGFTVELFDAAWAHGPSSSAPT